MAILFNNYLWLCFVISGLSISVSTIMIGFFVNDIGTSDVSEHDLDQDSSDGKNIWKIIRKSTTLILFIIALSFYQGAYLSERVPSKFRGRIYGVTNFASAFMSGIVEWGIGRLFDDYGLHYAWAFSIGMTMVSVIAAVALIYTDRKEFSDLYIKVEKT